MAYRTFTDPAWHAWHAWHAWGVRPAVPADGPATSAAFAPGYAVGWLVFERLPEGGPPAGGTPLDGVVPSTARRRAAPAVA